MACSTALCTGPRGTATTATSRSACRSRPAAPVFAAARAQAAALSRATQLESSGQSPQAAFNQQQALSSLNSLTFSAPLMRRGTRCTLRRRSGGKEGGRFIACSSSPTSPSSSGSDDSRDTPGTGKDAPNKGTPDGDAEEDLSGNLGDWREFRAKLVRSGIAETAVDPTAASMTTEQGVGESAEPGPGATDESADSRQADPGVAASDLQAAPAAISSPDVEAASSIQTADQASAASLGPQGGVVVPGEQETAAGTRLSGIGVAGAAPAGVPGSSAGALWAHPLAAPEQGCLVIAHPAAFGASQQYFNQAVIFLFTHGPEGSAGVILNRPSQYTLSQVAGLDEFVPEFAASPLYLGGDVGPTSMLCIHGIEELVESSGAQKICEGIYLGGSKGAKEHIQRGASVANDYRWFARYAGWAPGQLEREVESGYWFLAASSPRVVLKHCIQLKKPLWREVMEMMGGEYEKLSKRTYGEV